MIVVDAIDNHSWNSSNQRKENNSSQTCSSRANKTQISLLVSAATKKYRLRSVASSHVASATRMWDRIAFVPNVCGCTWKSGCSGQRRTRCDQVLKTARVRHPYYCLVFTASALRVASATIKLAWLFLQGRWSSTRPKLIPCAFRSKTTKRD